MKKMDEGHKETDELLGKLENRIADEYNTAYKEMAEKTRKYFERFNEKDKVMLAKVKAGEMKEKDYLTWRRNQMLTGGRYEAMRDVLAQDCTNANRIAMNMVYNNIKDAYAINANYGAFEVEKGSQMDTSFTLYDRKTVERLIRDDPDLLPKPRVDIPKDLRWNRNKINSALLQGILQGDSIPEIAARLQSVTGMLERAAVRNARTMTTGAECKGRIDSYKRAEAMGIKMKKMWVATLDGRTRHEHRILDGQQVEVNKPFEVDGYKLDCPGDPAGEPSMVYNCRCTVIAVIPDTKVSEEGIGILERDGKYKGMTYEEWKRGKSQPQKQEEKTPKLKKKVETPKPKPQKSETPKPQKIVETPKPKPQKSETPKPKAKPAPSAQKTKKVKNVADMNRRELVAEARKIYIEQNSKLGEAEARRRFEALIDGNTTAQLRKYVRRGRRKK